MFSTVIAVVRADLQPQKLVKYIHNQKNNGKDSVRAQLRNTGKARATVAPRKPPKVAPEDIFAKEHGEDIKTAARQLRDASTNELDDDASGASGSSDATPDDHRKKNKGESLTSYNQAKASLYAALPADVKAEYEEKAAAHNEDLEKGPTSQRIAE